MSENILIVSSQANKRYEAKIVSAGFRMDPYIIEDWNEVPEEVASDTMQKIVSTRICTKKIKVAKRKVQALLYNS